MKNTQIVHIALVQYKRYYLNKIASQLIWCATTAVFVSVKIPIVYWLVTNFQSGLYSPL